MRCVRITGLRFEDVNAVAIRAVMVGGTTGSARYEVKDEAGKWHGVIRAHNSNLDDIPSSTQITEWETVYEDCWFRVLRSKEIPL